MKSDNMFCINYTLTQTKGRPARVVTAIIALQPQYSCTHQNIRSAKSSTALCKMTVTAPSGRRSQGSNRSRGRNERSEQRFKERVLRERTLR